MQLRWVQSATLALAYLFGSVFYTLYTKITQNSILYLQEHPYPVILIKLFNCLLLLDLCICAQDNTKDITFFKVYNNAFTLRSYFPLSLFTMLKPSYNNNNIQKQPYIFDFFFYFWVWIYFWIFEFVVSIVWKLLHLKFNFLLCFDVINFFSCKMLKSKES